MRFVIDLIYRYVPKGSVVLAVTTFGSYALGLVRDRMFAQTFGASTVLDSYNAAFLVPDFAFTFLVASGIAAAAIPLFTQLRAGSKEEAHRYITSLMTLATLVMAGVGVLLFLFAPTVSGLVAPGISGEGRDIVIRLMRILAFSPVLFAASNALGAMLVAKKRFFLYGVSPIMYNLGIIGGAYFLSPSVGIEGVAYGTLIGAGLHLLVRGIDAMRSGWHLRASVAMPTGYMKKTLKLMAPKMIGHPIELVTFWVFTSLASFLSPGSISVLNFARNFQSVPVSILGITMATAVFPSLSRAALGPKKELRAMFYRTLVAITGISTLAAVFVYLIRYPLVSIVLGGGRFDADAVVQTATMLGVFCLAIPTESLNHLLARSFYATQNTSIPVVFSVISLLVAASSAYLFIPTMGILGISLGFFLGSFTKTIGLFVLFEYRLRSAKAMVR